jgi:hypothetical protein
MPRRAWFALAALVAWTVFLWLNRLVNAWGSATETTADKVVSTVLAGVLLGFALAGVVVLVRTWSAPLTAGWARVLRVFAGLTVVVWAVRVPQIFLADHELGFKVVHAALGVVAIALALAVWRTSRPMADAGPRAPQHTSTPVGAGRSAPVGDAGPRGARE